MTKEEGRPLRHESGAHCRSSKRERSTIAAVLVLFVAIVAAAELALCAALWVVTGP